MLVCQSRELMITVSWKDHRQMCGIKFIRLEDFLDSHTQGMPIYLEPQGILFAEVDHILAVKFLWSVYFYTITHAPFNGHFPWACYPIYAIVSKWSWISRPDAVSLSNQWHHWISLLSVHPTSTCCRKGHHPLLYQLVYTSTYIITSVC